MKALLKKIFNELSEKAVLKSIEENSEMKEMWELSKKVLPDLADHYATVKIENEALCRIRMLICAEALFLKNIILNIKEERGDIKNHLDIGDSDGAVRLLMLESLKEIKMDSLGIDIQPEAVENMKKKGLKAECVDAMKLSDMGRKFDVVSVFETLEHLYDPISFLKSMQGLTNERLVISVPLIVSSRVGLMYLSNKWPQGRVASSVTNHFFELSPKDWTKLFHHTGWEIDKKWEVKQFPKNGILKILMQYAWRKISFEGFLFVSLKKCDIYSSRFVDM